MMNRVSQSLMKGWIGLGSRFLPFADAATPDLPLSRLLRLSLFQVSVGIRSDTHRSELGWKRVPFIYKGTMLQFGGLAIMPFALLVLSGGGQAGHAPAWIGQLGAALSFLLVGVGLHTTQTVGLALATDLAPVESQPKVVGM